MNMCLVFVMCVCLLIVRKPGGRLGILCGFSRGSVIMVLVVSSCLLCVSSVLLSIVPVIVVFLNSMPVFLSSRLIVFEVVLLNTSIGCGLGVMIISFGLLCCLCVVSSVSS